MDNMTRSSILRAARSIAGDYKNRGLTLTLRQLYYQFVARGLLPSGQNVYKRIGDVLTEARYNGAFPIQWILDRGRDVNHGDFTRTFVTDHLRYAEQDARGMLAATPAFLAKRARWFGQRAHISVWVEKEALSGVFEAPCRDLGVGWFACKGYPSVSALYDWLKNTYFAHFGRHPSRDHALSPARRFTFGSGFDWTERYTASGCEESVVLYFGDHDPDGWEIPRSAERGLQKLMGTYGLAVPLRFERIALNMDQIREYRPPPFDAKITSARYRGYVDEHDTDEAWELDALDPDVLQDLIRSSVEGYFDDDIYERNAAEVDRLRRQLAGRLGVELGEE